MIMADDGLPSADFSGPALVDLQLNGYAGFDFNGDPDLWNSEQLHRIRLSLARRGVMAALPTLITDSPDLMLARVERYVELVSTDSQLASCFPKLHIEGPFISPFDGPRGAHPRRHCRAPAQLPQFVDRLADACGGRIGIVTLAPELPGAIELIGRCAELGVCAAIGHTRASREQINAVVAAGARMVTHLGNGADRMLDRLDNYIQYLLADDRLCASFVADGHHIPLTTLKNFIRAKTPERSVLVTDATAAAGMAPGHYTLGAETIVAHSDGRVTRPDESCLAGSSLTLDRAVINVHTHCGVSFEQAWAMASTIPAALVNLAPPPHITVRVDKNGFSRTTLPGEPESFEG